MREVAVPTIRLVISLRTYQRIAVLFESGKSRYYIHILLINYEHPIYAESVKP